MTRPKLQVPYHGLDGASGPGFGAHPVQNPTERGFQDGVAIVVDNGALRGIVPRLAALPSRAADPGPAWVARLASGGVQAAAGGTRDGGSARVAQAGRQELDARERPQRAVPGRSQGADRDRAGLLSRRL